VCFCCRSNKDLANKDHLEDVKRNVMVVGELIDILSGEQKYLHRKLDRHIQTVVSRAGIRWHACRRPSSRSQLLKYLVHVHKGRRLEAL
jgi:hypothetical protein